MYKRLLFLLVVGLFLFGLAGCGASPEVRAGRWEASTEYGDFAIIITPEGTAIQDVKYSFRCGDNSINDSNFRLTEPYPLDGRKLDFGVYLAGQVPMATWEAKFSRDGNTLSGTLELMAGGCSSDFEITR